MIDRYRLFLWATFLSFPLPFIATWTGWFTAEVGRQPWAVYGLLRTADAMTPFLTAQAAAISLVIFGIIYTFIFAFGIFYIYRLLRTGLVRPMLKPASAAVPNRPLSLAGEVHACWRKLENSHGDLLVSLLAVSILLYVCWTASIWHRDPVWADTDEARRHAMWGCR
jgi:hypothetical protein